MRLNTQKYRAITEEKEILDETVRKGIGMCKTTFSQLINDNLGGVSCEAMEGIAEVLGCKVGDISLSDLDDGENVIDWTLGAEKATVTFSQQKMITRIKKLAEKCPENVQIITENALGKGKKVLYAHVPAAWVRISPPKEMNFSEKQREEYSKRMKQLRNTQLHNA